MLNTFSSNVSLLHTHTTYTCMLIISMVVLMTTLSTHRGKAVMDRVNHLVKVLHPGNQHMNNGAWKDLETTSTYHKQACVSWVVSYHCSLSPTFYLPSCSERKWKHGDTTSDLLNQTSPLNSHCPPMVATQSETLSEIKLPSNNSHSYPMR